MVYSPHQQRMRYLVEFTIPEQDAHSHTGDGEGVEREPHDGVEGEASEDEGTDEGVAIQILYVYTLFDVYPILYSDSGRCEGRSRPHEQGEGGASSRGGRRSPPVSPREGSAH